MTTYKVTIKEANNNHVLHTSITTDQDVDYVCNFFGLENTDVEWYTIEKENEVSE